MSTLKEIAAKLDCHPKTLKRWCKRLGFPADIVGHGPNKWFAATAAALEAAYKQFYASRGTSPEIIRDKYAGLYSDPLQPQLPIFNSFIHVQTSRPQTRQETPAKSQASQAGSRPKSRASARAGTAAG